MTEMDDAQSQCVVCAFSACGDVGSTTYTRLGWQGWICCTRANVCAMAGDRRYGFFIQGTLSNFEDGRHEQASRVSNPALNWVCGFNRKGGCPGKACPVSPSRLLYPWRKLASSGFEGREATTAVIRDALELRPHLCRLRQEPGSGLLVRSRLLDDVLVYPRA